MLPASYQWPAPDVLRESVRRAQRDPSAVDALLSTIRPALHAFFRPRTDSDAAEDLTQLALVRIAGAIHRIDPERADSYLSAVARNLLRTSYRVRARDRRRTTSMEAGGDVAVEQVANERAEYADLARAVHRACLSIDQPALREVALGVLRGDSTGDLAAQLDVSPITIRTRLMRVRAVLRRELAAYLDDATAAG